MQNDSNPLNVNDASANLRAGNIPKHVAIIMDGNGRWAKKRGLQRLAGHHKGVEAVKRTIEAASELDIEYITLWAFSTENWRRPKTEVNGLMMLMQKTLHQYVNKLMEHNIRLRVIGNRNQLDPTLAQNIDEVVELTKNNTRLNLTLAVDYGGRDDIVHATKKIAQRVLDQEIDIDNITEDLFSQYTMTADMPDPDLFIRTSDVCRISNYMIWQLSYTELFFSKTYWPDFGKSDLEEAIAYYQGVERRFGDVVAR